MELPYSHKVFATFAPDGRTIKLMVWQAFVATTVPYIYIKKRGEEVRKVTCLREFDEIYQIYEMKG